MRIQVMSDLHFEYHPDGGHAWIDQLPKCDAEVLVLAGDIGEVRKGVLTGVLERFTSRYSEVVFVPGNHEYYGSEISECEALFTALDERLSNLHILRQRTVDIRGQRFVGATLWFPERSGLDHEFYKQRLNDFRQIKGGFEEWVAERAREDAAFLLREVRQGDVVVTHHIPSLRGVAPRWLSTVDGFGRFFVHELPEELIQRATLWCHGHGHDSVFSQINDHTLVGNPFGYLGVEENPQFDPALTLDV